jgi:hypothetical protein
MSGDRPGDELDDRSGAPQVAAGSFHSLALTAGGSVYSWGWNNDGQLGLGPLEMRTSIPYPLQVPATADEGSRLISYWAKMGTRCRCRGSDSCPIRVDLHRMSVLFAPPPPPSRTLVDIRRAREPGPPRSRAQSGRAFRARARRAQAKKGSEELPGELQPGSSARVTRTFAPASRPLHARLATPLRPPRTRSLRAGDSARRAHPDRRL